MTQSDRRRAVDYAARLAGALRELVLEGEVFDVSTEHLAKHGEVILVVLRSGPATAEARYSVHEIERTPAGADVGIETRARYLLLAARERVYGIVESAQENDAGGWDVLEVEQVTRA